MTTPAPDNTATQVAVVIARLDDVREDIAQLRDAITTSSAEKVGRGEWIQRNQHVDSRFQQLGREVAQLRTELAARRLPWPAVAAVVVSIATLVWTVLGP
jgi:hypothetical protein